MCYKLITYTHLFYLLYFPFFIPLLSSFIFPLPCLHVKLHYILSSSQFSSVSLYIHTHSPFSRFPPLVYPNKVSLMWEITQDSKSHLLLYFSLLFSLSQCMYFHVPRVWAVISEEEREEVY